MASIHPHIHFNGNTEEALNKIMHIALPIDAGSAIKGSDVPKMLGTVSKMKTEVK
jgi:hypothetical protein